MESQQHDINDHHKGNVENYFGSENSPYLEKIVRTAVPRDGNEMIHNSTHTIKCRRAMKQKTMLQ